MQKTHKDLLRTIVTQLRRLLGGYWDEHGGYQRGDLDRELERLGFDPTGNLMPLDGLRNPTPAQEHAHRVVTAQLATLPADATTQAVINLRHEIIERSAYSWINRLLALRTMEARGLLEETLRPTYDGVSEALFILRETAPQRTTGPDSGWWAVIEDACAALTPILPGLFDLTDPNTALRPSTPVLLEVIKLVGGNHPAFAKVEEGSNEALFQEPDVIGWAYQFYQEEAKARVYAKLGKKGKVETRSEIAAATQLFTESYMVQWMLQNSLGRSYHEAYPTSKLPETWAYYIRPENINEHSSGHAIIFPLDQLTFLDIAMGSGHILREAFDMFFAMYREQRPEMTSDEIANRILTHHLHGIDIDPRAAQLAALTLLLRAYEQCSRPLAVGGLGRGLNLATTPTGLDSGALERHLARHPEDELYRPILVGLFAALEQAQILGSLLRPSAHLDEAIATFKRQHKGGQLGLSEEGAGLNRLLDELARHDPAALKAMLVESISRSFRRDAQVSDVGVLLLGREAVTGLHLLELLERKYTVVVTNPPYMGSKNMNPILKKYVKQQYKLGKRDLYAAFILRCLEMTHHAGRVGMVTPNSWSTQKSYKELRKRIIESNQIVSVVQLGRHAFSEADPPGFPHLFALQKLVPLDNHLIASVEHPISLRSEDQAKLLAEYTTGGNYNLSKQASLLHIVNTPLLLSMPGRMLEQISEKAPLNFYASVPKGISTAKNERFLRCHWEVAKGQRWFRYAKGGGFSKWYGLMWYQIDYEYSGSRLKATESAVLRNPSHYFMSGYTYTEVARGSLGVRVLDSDTLFDARSPGIFVKMMFDKSVIAVLNSRVSSLLFRQLSPGILLDQAYAPQIAVFMPPHKEQLHILSQVLEVFKFKRICTEITEDCFALDIFMSFSPATLHVFHLLLGAAHSTVSARLEQIVIYETDIAPFAKYILSMTGTPAGWYPLISGYDKPIHSLRGTNLPKFPENVIDYISTHTRILLTSEEIEQIKNRLQILYEAGPGSKDSFAEIESAINPDDSDDSDDSDDESTVNAYIPIPPETFLEELSLKLQLHPISVYWLLEELRSHGIRCRPEEQRMLEDRLTVVVLSLLGHRWPKQIEADEPVPAWADPDGIIPLTAGCGEATLAERVRERLRADEGDLGAQRTEALLQELTGRTLADWLRRDFFKRHVSQFKKSPIAWHLQSTPIVFSQGGRGKRRGSRQEPAFECVIYYHRCDTDILARIRTQYVEPLLAQETRRQTEARRALLPGVADNLQNAGGEAETVIAQTVARIQELQEFIEQLRTVEDQGFACAELEKLLADEPLDRWNGDGQHAPADHATLMAQEQAWRVDINDGVRVNIAPLQQAGLLAQEVLNRQDVPNAIADRARWRADERHWVRQGKLPRCGWMSESIPESSKWTELAPEREAERRRLEEKRQQVLTELES